MNLRHPPRSSRPLRTGTGSADAALEVTAAAVVASTLWIWVSGQIAAWLSAGCWPPVPLVDVASIVANLPAHLEDPRLAWPAPARAALPGPFLFDGCALALLLLGAVVGLYTWRLCVRRVPSQRRASAGGRGLGGGARWARRDDLGSLRATGSARLGRLTLGSAGGGIGGRRRLLCTEARHSLLVIGPTQSGKTSALAVPALLEWPGPAIATSVKDDLAAMTLGWRSQSGRCWVFDPTMTSGLRPVAAWSPLSACGDWSAAQRMAGWLVDATPARTGMSDAAFWYAAAAKQLAPLLRAAATGGMTMGDVVRWTNAGDFDEPGRLLQLSGEGDGAAALAACAGRDPRILSSVLTTLETVLAPFEDPVVSRSTDRSDIDVDELLAGRGSLYLCGPSHEQHRVQGLFAALVSAAIAAAVRRVNDTRLPLDPPLLIVLDEAANIAPIRDLDTLASTGAGMGVQIVTVCQDLAQLAARYGSERSRTIANNHRAKLLLSGVADLTTLDLVSGLAGEAAIREETITHDLRDGRRTRSHAVAFRRLAPTDELRRIPPGEGVLVYGHLPPVRLKLRPWYADATFRARAGDPRP